MCEEDLEMELEYDEEYEYYTEDDEEADGEEEEEDDDETIKNVPIRKDSNWRKKFEEEINSPDHCRESPFEPERERRYAKKERTQLHIAVMEDDVFLLNKLLNEGEDPNAQDGAGITPLHLACMENRQNLAIILMSRGGDGSVVDQSRKSPLHYAVEKGLTRIVQTLLENGETYLEGKDRNGQTVLHVAAFEELSSTLSTLLSRAKKNGTEADVSRFVNMLNRDRQTALHIAAEKGFCDGVKLLLAYKPDVSVKDVEGQTALHLACGASTDQASEYQTAAVVEILINHEAGVNVKDENGITPLMQCAKSGRIESAKILLKCGAQMNAKDSKGLTALHHAARNYQAKFIKMIVKRGMAIDVKDKKQLTGIHHAISVNCLDAVKALCEAGADITMEDTEGRRYMEYASMYGSYKILVWFAKKYPELYINDETKETILHFAASQGLTEVIKCLLKTNSFNIDTRDFNEKTPLHYAALNGADEVFEYLVGSKADIDALDAVGATPLHFAVRWGSESIVKFILRKKGTDVASVLDSGDRLGRTPLHYAASQKTGLSYITNLLKAGANIDAQDYSGMTPLHLACRFGNISLVRMLLDEGADKSLVDLQGMTAKDHAKEKECVTIIGMVDKSGKRKECTNRINC